MATDPYELNLRHLRGSLAIAEFGSITAAAGAVSLSQPALTQGLAKLEGQFGYTLFERRSSGMVAAARVSTICPIGVATIPLDRRSNSV